MLYSGSELTYHPGLVTDFQPGKYRVCPRRNAGLKTVIRLTVLGLRTGRKSTLQHIAGGPAIRNPTIGRKEWISYIHQSKKRFATNSSNGFP